MHWWFLLFGLLIDLAVVNEITWVVSFCLDRFYVSFAYTWETLALHCLLYLVVVVTIDLLL